MAKEKAEEKAYGEAEVQETLPEQTEMSAMEYRQLMLLWEDVQKANQFQETDNATKNPEGWILMHHRGVIKQHINRIKNLKERKKVFSNFCYSNNKQ